VFRGPDVASGPDVAQACFRNITNRKAAFFSTFIAEKRLVKLTAKENFQPKKNLGRVEFSHFANFYDNDEAFFLSTSK
jgi:hypothetical protein